MLQRHLFVVLVTGLEPVRYCYRGILSPLRLPIPPHQHDYNINCITEKKQKQVYFKIYFDKIKI